MTRIDKACYERGCACHDDRVDGETVEVVQRREWVGLTDEDVDEVERWIEFKEDGSERIPTQKLVRYIERKLKEKNT